MRHSNLWQTWRNRSMAGLPRFGLSGWATTPEPLDQCKYFSQVYARITQLTSSPKSVAPLVFKGLTRRHRLTPTQGSLAAIQSSASAMMEQERRIASLHDVLRGFSWRGTSLGFSHAQILPARIVTAIPRIACNPYRRGSLASYTFARSEKLADTEGEFR